MASSRVSLLTYYRGANLQEENTEVAASPTPARLRERGNKAKGRIIAEVPPSRTARANGNTIPTPFIGRNVRA